MVSLLALVLAATPLSAASDHLKAGRLDELVFDLADSVTLAPADVPEAAHLLGQGAAAAQAKGDTMLALQLAQTAHRRDAQQLDALRVLTELALRDQSFNDADRYADALSQAAPHDAHVTLLRARVAAAEEDWAPASALSGPLAAERSLSPQEQQEAQAIHAQAAPFLAKQQTSASTTSIEEARLHEAGQRAAQLRAMAAEAEPETSGTLGSGSVVLYGTTWCHFCKQARAYFQQRHIPFEDKDIEADADAAHEMQTKEVAAGLHGSGVPVIDVYGTLIRGFDRRAIDRALKHGGG